MRRTFIALVGLALVTSGCNCGTGTATTGAHNTSGASGSSGSHGATSGGSGSGSGSTTGSGAGSGAGAGTATNGGHGAVTQLEIAPDPGQVDVYANAGSTTFTATAIYADGTHTQVSPDWSFDRGDLATIDGTGTLTAVGQLGGDGTLTATYGGVSATDPIAVVLHMVANTANLSASDQALFDSPDGNASGTLLYPYDKTVFAKGLLSPDLMWSGGNAGDSYRVHLSEHDFDAVLYVSADPPSDVPVPQDVWDTLTNVNGGDPVAVEIERLSGGAAHAAMTESWIIAPGSLRGSIYYWAVNKGQLMKITPGSATPTVVFDSGDNTQLGTPAPANYDGTSPPWSTGGDSKRCVACHTVSKDGSTAVAVFERKDSAPSPWGTIDLTAATPDVVQIQSYDRNTLFLGLTPDGMYAVENDIDFSMHLYDSHLGTELSSALDAMTLNADPAFSPDGSKLAYASSVTGSYPVEYTRADLSVMDFTASSATFANPRMVVSGGSEAVAFPSFSPDSNWIFYQYGDYSRAKYGTNSTGHDDLYVTDVAGAVGPLLLANASGSNLDPRNQQRSYQPTVNPISVGGYTWVVFVSPRDYGNKMLSTSDATYENNKQLWVAAIDSNPQPGTDPSHPAFWLPSQDLTTINMSGYWALEACHDTGGSCTQGFECCSGYCNVSNEIGTCGTGPTGGGCSQIGDACQTDANCCGSNASCIGGFCAVKFQ